MAPVRRPPPDRKAQIRRALLSVSDKRDLAAFGSALVEMGVEVVSTGGTYAHLVEAGVPATKVSDVTGFPEILGGRVKTLHPRIHGGILADRAVEGHLAELEAHGIAPIDLVVVNLYPFRETAAGGASFDEVVEMIDVGGPAMLRAAAKNHRGVLVVVDPGDYPAVLAHLRTAGEDSHGPAAEAFRRSLAAKAFAHTRDYDAAIAAWLEARAGRAGERFPETSTLALERVLVPRYGENPHQDAAVYRISGGTGVLGGFSQLQGKELSYNNLLDTDAARKLVALFDEPAVAIIKHNNPCGVGRGADLVAAYRRAFDCDPVSAFGSIIALNRPAAAELAGAMAELFVEVVVAPAFEPGAREIFGRKTNLRLLACPPYQPRPEEIELKGIDGGFLAQVPDGYAEDASSWSCVTRREPTAEERRGLALAWKVARYVKSNAIVLADGDATLGIGAGQMSRVDSCHLAVRKASERPALLLGKGPPLAGAVAASDAFFPFRDGLDALAEAGIKAVVQPGGSKRDAEVITAADEHGIAMLFTGQRHFRH